MKRFVRVLLFAAVLSGPSAALPLSAQAEQRLEAIDLPSTQGNVDLSKVTLNKGMTALKATVLLPDGYDDHPDKAYPVLYLLHGGGDTSETWAQANKGNIRQTAKDFPGIVVMPEGGRDSFTDWWQGGARNGPRWTRYYLDEVFPAIESRYRILPGRQNHAIGGLSMGATGAYFLGGLLPGYFGTIVSMSGLMDQQSIENLAIAQYGSGVSYETIWGPITGPYAEAHNPSRTIQNVRSSRVYISSGNGVPDPTLPIRANEWTLGLIAESRLGASAIQFGLTAPLLGLKPTIKIRIGLHAWEYWARELPKAISWGLFTPGPVTDVAEAKSWEYKTMEPAGNAWGIGYRFAAPTTKVTTFKRSGQTLQGSGTGTVTINPGAADVDATGAGTRPDCSFTAALPFKRTLPAGC